MTRVLLTILAALGVLSSAGAAYPDRPIRFIIPSAAGGAPEEFLALSKRETVKWVEVVKRAGAKLD